jgi:hypothetical protein
MPTYCFRRRDTGQTVELVMPMSRLKNTVRLPGGVKADRDRNAELADMVRTPPGNWPLLSDAAGCHPKQRVHMMREAKRMGVPTDFTRDGQAVFTSARHRKRYCEKIGLFDRNGGHSDPQPKNVTRFSERVLRQHRR